GHRETQPMLTQQRLNAVTSEKCSLSLVLFDEIEKAAPSMTRLLLGVLDKGILRLGDNSPVYFAKRTSSFNRSTPPSASTPPANPRTSRWWRSASASRPSSSTASTASSRTSR